MNERRAFITRRVRGQLSVSAGVRPRPFTELRGCLIGFHSSINAFWLSPAEYAPAERDRSKLALTVLSLRRSRVVSLRESHSIDRGIARSGAVCDQSELRRNRGPARYRASTADQAAWNRSCRPRFVDWYRTALAHLAASKLRLKWSPEQIAGWLQRTF